MLYVYYSSEERGADVQVLTVGNSQQSQPEAADNRQHRTVST